jgi:hypothetical protein
LRNNGADPLTIHEDGVFAFSQPMRDGAAYAVSVASNPLKAACDVSQGSGVVEGADVQASVRCAPGAVPYYVVRASVSGLSDGALVLRNNGDDDLAVKANGEFPFKTHLPEGHGYSVTVATHPAGETCTVSNGSGTAKGDVDVQVACCECKPGTTESCGSDGSSTRTCGPDCQWQPGCECRQGLTSCKNPSLKTPVLACVDLRSNVRNCGACGRGCNLDTQGVRGAKASCQDGACKFDCGGVSVCNAAGPCSGSACKVCCVACALGGGCVPTPQ